MSPNAHAQLTGPDNLGGFERRAAPAVAAEYPAISYATRAPSFDGEHADDSIAATPENRVWSAAPAHRAIDELAEIDLDRLDREHLHALLFEVTAPIRRLEAARARVTGALHRRESAGPSRPGAADRVCRDFLTGQLGLSPAEAKDVTGTSKRLPDAPTTAKAYQGGQLTSRHTSVIASCLEHIPLPHRATVEAELLDLAIRADPVALGRRARQLVAIHDAGELHTVERRRQTRRRFSYHDAEDGALRFSGELYGIDAEQARTAFEAFTPRPQTDDRRSHDHRRADGFVSMAGAALRAGEAPTQHGVRPHVLIVIDHEQLRRHNARMPAHVRLGAGEPASFHDIRYAFDDCDVTRIVLGAKRTPLEASVAVRTVPTGLWRVLQARDQGCTWDGCTAPIAWCDVAHLDEPYAAGGRLSPSNAALLCRRHHRRYDGGGWHAEIHGDSVIYHADPTRPAVASVIHRDRQDRHGTTADARTVVNSRPEREPRNVGTRPVRSAGSRQSSDHRIRPNLQLASPDDPPPAVRRQTSQPRDRPGGSQHGAQLTLTESSTRGPP